jgi:UDP-N-acetylmuramyl pentapeptide phosphotransferase/UDP-N-acetylglucosamine-1-phosphate transferase
MEFFLVIAALILSFILVILSVPSILKVARAKKLFDPSNIRKIHTQLVPPLGGIAIFIGFILGTLVSTNGFSFDSLKYIIASVILMFFIGLKDDLLDIAPIKKFIVQIFAGGLLIFLGQLSITNLHGILGIYGIHYFIGIFLTLFIILVSINAFNMIDGIDGLASILAIIGSGFFGIWFYLNGNIQFAIMSFALVGSLTGFFIFNVFGNKSKMFMGDTGSLIVGIVMAVLVIKFNEENITTTSLYKIKAAPMVSFAVMVVPMVDILRVMTMRILDGRSVFSADRNHIHHRMLELIPSHLHVTLIMGSVNFVYIGIALILDNFSINATFKFLIIFLTGILISFVPSWIIRWKKN